MLLASIGSLCVRGAAVRCAIWTACVVALAVAPAASALLPHVYLAHAGPFEPLHFPSTIARPHTASVGQDSFWTFTEGSWSDGACQTVVYVWLAGASLTAVRLAVGWTAMVRHMRRARPCRRPRVRAIVDRLVVPGEKVSVLELHGLAAAVCGQIHRPKIILPAHMDGLSDAELEMMIRHELAHIRRSDSGMLFLQRLVEILLWFHPLVWLMACQMLKYREFVCDDLVLAGGCKPNDYARFLGQLAAWFDAPLPAAPAGLGMLWGQHLVLHRVKRLLHAPREVSDFSVRARTGLYATLALIVSLVGLARLDWTTPSVEQPICWTAWPSWSARALDTLGIRVRDFPLDGHRYDPHEP